MWNSTAQPKGCGSEQGASLQTGDPSSTRNDELDVIFWLCTAPGCSLPEAANPARSLWSCSISSGRPTIPKPPPRAADTGISGMHVVRASGLLAGRLQGPHALGKREPQRMPLPRWRGAGTPKPALPGGGGAARLPPFLPAVGDQAPTSQLQDAQNCHFFASLG